MLLIVDNPIFLSITVFVMIAFHFVLTKSCPIDSSSVHAYFNKVANLTFCQVVFPFVVFCIYEYELIDSIGCSHQFYFSCDLNHFHFYWLHGLFPSLISTPSLCIPLRTPIFSTIPDPPIGSWEPGIMTASLHWTLPSRPPLRLKHRRVACKITEELIFSVNICNSVYLLVTCWISTWRYFSVVCGAKLCWSLPAGGFRFLSLVAWRCDAVVITLEVLVI